MNVRENNVAGLGVDRRVVRTKRALQHAFLKLIVERGYDNVTIQDICDAADVGRSTFYLHFADKDALKRSGLDHLRHGLIAYQERLLATGTSPVPLGFSLPMFEHAKGHLHIYRALAGSSGNGVALGTIREILTDQLRSDPVIFKIASPADRELRTHFVLGALMAVLTWWLDAGAPGDPNDIDRKFKDLALPGLQ